MFCCEVRQQKKPSRLSKRKLRHMDGNFSLVPENSRKEGMTCEASMIHCWLCYVSGYVFFHWVKLLVATQQETRTNKADARYQCCVYSALHPRRPDAVPRIYGTGDVKWHEAEEGFQKAKNIKVFDHLKRMNCSMLASLCLDDPCTTVRHTLCFEA